MALTGQLNDLSLCELIEFFCNQRKTGRLKVDFALTPGVFFIKEGELVDAKLGALNGADAIYFALTLPSASFDFSAQVQSSRRTITDSYTRVLLEGLRRLDEGIAPAEAAAFAGDEHLDEATAVYLDSLEAAEIQTATKADPKQVVAASAAAAGSSSTSSFASAAPMSLMVESAGEGSGKRKLVLASVMGAAVLACAVAAIPLSKRFSHADVPAATSSSVAAQPSNAPVPSSDNLQPLAGDLPSNTTGGEAVASSPEVAAAAGGEDPATVVRREAQAREAARLARERKREDAARKTDAAEQLKNAPAPANVAAASSQKTVRVSIAYDEAGRVTQASAVGSSPGAEAYAATAVRVARGRRFPAGKPGSTVVTIPIN